MGSSSVIDLLGGEWPPSSRNSERQRGSQPQTNLEQEIYDREWKDNGGSPERTGTITLKVTDPDIFDCRICKRTLTAPVFQCNNGHLVCSYCFTTRNKKYCSSCNEPIGSNRCRAIEKVLESAKVDCYYSKYRCKETISYSNKIQHQIYCKYAPCSCPISECKFVAASRQLYQHFSAKHQKLAVKLRYNLLSHITLNVHDKFLVLQEEKDYGVLFILNNKAIEPAGNEVSVKCIKSFVKKFCYDITARCGVGTTLSIQSFTMSSPQWYDRSSALGFLVVPPFLGSNGKLKLEICIYEPGADLAGHC